MKIKVDLEDMDGSGRWRAAIHLWGLGDETRVLALLQSAAPIPAFAGAWLAEVLQGHVKRKLGRRKVEQSASQMLILFGLFDYAPEGRALPRTREGYAAAAVLIGATPRQVEAWLPKVRKNTRGHKPYSWRQTGNLSPADPFGLTRKIKPK